METETNNPTPTAIKTEKEENNVVTKLAPVEVVVVKQEQGTNGLETGKTTELQQKIIRQIEVSFLPNPSGIYLIVFHNFSVLLWRF